MSVEGFTEVEQDGDVVALQADEVATLLSLSAQKDDYKEENADVESSTKKRGRPPKALKDSDAKAKTLELWKTTYYMRLKEELTSNQVIYREFVEEL
jgi:hypothetical protein